MQFNINSDDYLAVSSPCPNLPAQKHAREKLGKY